MSHYALVSRSEPLPLDDREETSVDIRTELTDVFQSYADLYPNPNLTEEARLRDTLLQAASAAANAKQQNKKRPKTSGFFSRLFGSPPPPEEDDETAKKPTIEDPLVYTDLLNDEDTDLCGTMQSLDTKCIPDEAYSVARFHLTSARTRREQPNAVRVGATTTSRPLVLAGVGAIAEFQADGASRVLWTSDRDELRDFCAAIPGYHVSQARAVAVGPNCLAISWGFVDGVVIFYRRAIFPEFEGWEQVWMLGPSRAILENMPDLFQDEEGSPQLRVSDMLPLLVESPASEAQTEPPMVATLAIARLGGYIELIPLPTPLWYGPDFTPDNHKRPGRKAKRKRGQHYAVGKQIGALDHTIALTTIEYHTDIQCLEAFRTQVTGDTEWDMQAFPDTPPAEFVVAASGMSKHGHETVTFWAVSTLFSDDIGTRSKTNDNAGMGFRIHATVIEALTAASGADVTIFATPGIMKRWRTPRHVELRADASLGESRNDSDGEELDKVPEAPARITTISTAAPLVAMRFATSDGTYASHSGPFLSLLDWNGSVTILDCSFMERVAAQSLSKQEYELYRSSNHHLPFPLAIAIVNRSHFVDCLRKNKGGSIKVPNPVVNLHWLTSAGPSAGSLPPLALLLKKPRQLQIITFSLPETERDDAPPKSSLISMTFPAHGATMSSFEDGNLSFVSQRKGNNEHLPSLKLFVMQRLQPQTIIQSLASASKYEEAIQAASRLSEEDQTVLEEVVRECHKRIWETKRDVDSLAESGDIGYIVQEARTLCHLENPDEIVTLDKLRIVCSLALVMGKNSQPVQESIEEIRYFLVKLGSYELLCRHFSVEGSFKRFREEFCQVPTRDLALKFSRAAEVAALSILLFRQRRDVVEDYLGIIDQIPVSVNPANCSHLFPIVRDKHVSDSFLPAVHNGPPLHWSIMPQYLNDKDGIYIVLDARDEKMVLDYNRNSLTPIGDADECDLASLTATWFASRARKMQLFLGEVQPVILLCELGLRCSHPEIETANLPTAPAAVQQLYKTWRSAIALQQMLADGVVSIGIGESSSPNMLSINTEQILEMELVDVVSLVLHGESDRSEILSRCTRYLQPLLADISRSSTSDSTTELDTAIASYCIGLVRGCANIDTQDKEKEAELVAHARKALASCAAIAAASRTSTTMQSRLVKDKKALTEMVLSAIDETSHACERLSIPPTDSRHLIDALWDMYEALPIHIPSSVPSSESWVPLLEKLEKLYTDLVGVDVLSRWPGCRPFSFYVQRQRQRKQEEPSSDESSIEEGSMILAKLCRSFITQVKSGENEYTLERSYSLLHDLLSDISEIYEICYSRALFLPQVMCTYLIGPLLHLEQFLLVAEFLSKAKNDFLNREQAKNVILSYVNGAVFADGDDSAKIASAIRCQDVIGPVFPEIRNGFMAVRRYLDAANFIGTVIYDDRAPKTIKPSDLRKQLPLDVVESILADVPISVVCGCTEWLDTNFAREANDTLRRALVQSMEPTEGPPTLPKLPGGAIFHLATILGLEDDVSASVVKSRVVHYAVAEGLYGAAAAICRTLVSDQTALGNESEALMKVGAVAQIVCEKSYADIFTKRELCIAALQKFTGKLSTVESDAFNAVLAESAELEHRCSRFSREYGELSSSHRQTINHRPVSRLYDHVRREYNGDIHALFTDMIGQTSTCHIHDSLMNALSRFVMYWCIADSVKLKTFLDIAEKADAREVLAMGASLILHIPSEDTALTCVRELQNIAADQAARVSTEERFTSKSDLCVPDPAIVRQLIGRGYTENGARRAVVMTQNSGFKAALGFAVAHSMDQDFNDPIAVIRIPNQKFVDEDAIQNLLKCLHTSGNFVEQPSTRETFLRALKAMQKVYSEKERPTVKVSSKPANSSPDSQKRPPANKVTHPHPPPTPPGFRSKTKEIVTASDKEGLRLDQSSDSSTAAHRAAAKGNGQQAKIGVVSKGTSPLLPPLPKAMPSLAQRSNGVSASPKEQQRSSPAPVKPTPKASVVPPPPTLPISNVSRAAPSAVPNATTEMKPRLPTEATAAIVGTKRPGVVPTAMVGTLELKPRLPTEPPAAIVGTKRPGVVPTAMVGTFKPGGGLKVDTAVSAASKPSLQTPVSTRSSPLSAQDRSELRKRGEDALTKLRNSSSPAEDRRRLIEEGRQLLRKARMISGAPAPSPPTTLRRAPPKVVAPPSPKRGSLSMEMHSHAHPSGAPAPSPPKTSRKVAPLPSRQRSSLSMERQSHAQPLGAPVPSPSTTSRKVVPLPSTGATQSMEMHSQSHPSGTPSQSTTSRKVVPVASPDRAKQHMDTYSPAQPEGAPRRSSRKSSSPSKGARKVASPFLTFNSPMGTSPRNKAPSNKKVTMSKHASLLGMGPMGGGKSTGAPALSTSRRSLVNVRNLSVASNHAPKAAPPPMSSMQNAAWDFGDDDSEDDL